MYFTRENEPDFLLLFGQCGWNEIFDHHQNVLQIVNLNGIAACDFGHFGHLLSLAPLPFAFSEKGSHYVTILVFIWDPASAT